MRDESQRGRSNTAKVVVHDRQVQHVQVGDVARHMKREYLISLTKDFLAREKAAHHNGAPVGSVTLTQDKFAIGERLDRMGHVRQLLAILLRYAKSGLQTRDQFSVGHSSDFFDVRARQAAAYRDNVALHKPVAAESSNFLSPGQIITMATSHFTHFTAKAPVQSLLTATMLRAGSFEASAKPNKCCDRRAAERRWLSAVDLV